VKLLSNTALIRKLIFSKTFRDSYVHEHLKNGISFQIRSMREDRGWTQGELGAAARKPRNVITRLEDPNYGKLTIKTLLEMASAFDVALLIKFIPFSRLLREYDDTSPAALTARSIIKDKQQLSRWAQNKDKVSAGHLVYESHQLPLPLDDLTNASDTGCVPKDNLVLFPIRHHLDYQDHVGQVIQGGDTGTNDSLSIGVAVH
jgi:transcriptional regulator with XRE-family HTH domain